MITTFSIETCAALYVLYRYRFDKSSQIIITLLAALATFQLAEYMVCTTAFYLSSLDWARIGYAAITILPPLAIHLQLNIAKKKNQPLLVAAYGSSLMFMTFFLFIGHGITAGQCLGNYVIFQVAPYIVLPYSLYYQGWLLAGLALCWKSYGKLQNKKRQNAMWWLMVGYLSFMVPSNVIYLINRETAAGLPSIMCGFAVLFALSLLFKVAPLLLEETNKETQHIQTSN